MIFLHSSERLPSHRAGLFLMATGHELRSITQKPIQAHVDDDIHSVSAETGYSWEEFVFGGSIELDHLDASKPARHNPHTVRPTLPPSPQATYFLPSPPRYPTHTQYFKPESCILTNHPRRHHHHHQEQQQ